METRKEDALPSAILAKPKVSLTEKIGPIWNVFASLRHYFYGDELARMARASKAFHRINTQFPLLNFDNPDAKSSHGNSFRELFEKARAFDESALPEFKCGHSSKTKYLVWLKRNGIRNLMTNVIEKSEGTDFVFEWLEYYKAMLKINLRIEFTLSDVGRLISQRRKNFLLAPFLSGVEKIFPDAYPHVLTERFQVAISDKIPQVFQVIEYLEKTPNDINKTALNVGLQLALSEEGYPKRLVGNVATIQRLLTAGADFQVLLESKFEILSGAVHAASVRVVDFLLQQNIPEIIHQSDYVSVLLKRTETERRNADQHTLIHSLFRYGARFRFENLRVAIKYEWFNLLEMLLQKMIEANVDINNPEDGKDPLIFSAQTLEQLEVLLKMGVDPLVRNSTGTTSLMHFSSGTDINAVALLLEKKVDVNAQARTGRTALMESVIHDRPAIARQLLAAGAETDIKNQEGGYFPIVLQALRSSEMIGLLLKYKADGNIATETGDTPLMLTIGCYSTNKNSYPHPAKSVDDLLDYKANVTARNNNGITAFSYALELCLRSKVRKISSFVNESASESDRRYYKKSKAIVMSLLQAGADPNDKTPNGETSWAVALACHHNDEEEPTLLELLCQHPHFKINDPDKEGKTPVAHAVKNTKTLRLLLSHKANPNTPDNKKVTPLMTACDALYAANIRELAALLLEAKADIHAVDENQQTALFYRCKYLDSDTITLLLDQKSDVHQRDKDGNTPLLFALRHLTTTGHVCTAETLLNRNADLTIKNNQGENALDICRNVPETLWVYRFKENVKVAIQKNAISDNVCVEQLSRMDVADEKQVINQSSVVSPNNNASLHSVAIVSNVSREAGHRNNSIFQGKSKNQTKRQAAQTSSLERSCAI